MASENKKIKKIMKNQGYKLLGKGGAVKLCHWLKKKMRNEGGCYKERFYGIDSHRCLQMTPTYIHCTQKCLFCWRNYDVSQQNDAKLENYLEPKEMLDSAIHFQRVLLSGFGGSLDIYDKDRWEESKNPKHIAISLAGEPTVYPKLSEFIKTSHTRDMTTFVVSNGTFPESIADMNPQPTQLYLSLDAPDSKTYSKLCRPQIKNGWVKILKSLEILSEMNTRTVIRITGVKGYNMHSPSSYTRLIELADPDFVEVKAYMHVGESRKRLERNCMPSHDEILNFAGQIANSSNYIFLDEVSESRVCLLGKEDTNKKIDFSSD